MTQHSSSPSNYRISWILSTLQFSKTEFQVLNIGLYRFSDKQHQNTLRFFKTGLDFPVKGNIKKNHYYAVRIIISWWSITGSNRWPPACKAGALPAELIPHVYLNSMVGLNGLEPTTSPLSGVRSNHLSYRPVAIECSYIIPLLFLCVNNVFIIFFF